MLKARTPLLVGLLLLGAVAAFVFSFGSLERGFSDDELYTVYARFDDASGLAPDSRIVLAGIEVGKLGEPILDPQAPSKARVPLRVKKEVQLRKGIWDPDKKRWVNGAQAVRRQASLIGDYDVVLSPGIDGEIIPPEGEIGNVVSDSGLSAIMRAVEDSSSRIFPEFEKISKDISVVTGALRESLGDEQSSAAIKQIREDVQAITNNVKEVTEEMRGFLREQVYARGGDIQQIVRNLEVATGRLATAAGPAVERLDQILERIDRVAGSIEGYVTEQMTSPPGTERATVQKSLALLQGSAENIRKVTQKLEEGRGTLGRLLTDDKLIQDIEKVVGDVEEFTSTFSRTEIEVGLRTDYFIGRDAFKTTVDFRLSPGPDKYYLLQLIDDPLGRSTRRTRVTTTNDPRLPPVLVEDISETSSDFKISAQFAKRWNWLTFRMGILESTGALGLDATFLDRALEFRLDAFEFGRDEYPRLRVLAQWEFWNHFLLAGGFDDVLNAPSRDWFLGIGLRFFDSDLKSVLPFTPTP
ncbi:MAG: MCE family protein [Deltaproteobacteria bacterium]|nr:MCE family protein [Deltaproteobacteria bacterium]